MKKPLLGLLSGLLMVCSANFVLGQQVSNGDFETWVETGTFEHPVVSPAPFFYSTNIESFYQHNMLTVTKVTGVSGSALRVETIQTPEEDTILAAAAWGNVEGGAFNQGIPLPGNEPLTGISLYLRYSCTPETPGFIGVIPMKNGSPAGFGNSSVPGAYVYPLSGTQSTFSLTNYTFSPALLLNPDSCLIIIAAADLIDTEKGTPGDYIEVDELTWIGNSNTLYGGSLDVWQNVPTFEIPEDWTVGNNGNNENFAKSSDAHSGNYSLELYNTSEDWGLSLGRAVLGYYKNCSDGGPCTPVPGMKILSTPKAFGFYYKYTAPGLDTASFYINFYNSGTQLEGTGGSLLPTSEWKYHLVTLPNPSSTPDSIFISFESGRWQTGLAGSSLKIDGLKLHYCDDASVIEGPSSVCNPSSDVQFVISEEFASAYAWSTTIGTISGSNTNDTVTIDDITAAGTISVIKSYADGCPDKQFDFNISVTSAAAANANADQILCANNAHVMLNGSVTGATGGSWSGGTGTFDNNNSLTATYIPSPTEITAGSVTLTLTPTGTGGCAVTTDDILITFTTAPTVDAGSNQTKCGNNALTTLAGSYTVSTGIQWTTLGSGSFSNSTSTTSTYTPSVNDVQSGSVKLVIATTGNGDCNVVRDTMQITLTPSPTANAGSDQSVCSSSPDVVLAGSLTVATEGTWSGGTGTFVPDANTLNATYTPSATEIAAGTVTLTLTTTDHGTCNAVSDDMVITINVCTGTAQSTLQESVSFYPNPSSSFVTIDFGQSMNVQSIHVLNSLQQEVQYSPVNNVVDQHELSLDGLDSGIYMVLIRSEYGTIVKKVIKE